MTKLEEMKASLSIYITVINRVRKLKGRIGEYYVMYGDLDDEAILILSTEEWENTMYSTHTFIEMYQYIRGLRDGLENIY